VWKVISCQWDVLCYHAGSYFSWSSTFHSLIRLFVLCLWFINSFFYSLTVSLSFLLSTCKNLFLIKEACTHILFSSLSLRVKRGEPALKTLLRNFLTWLLRFVILLLLLLLLLLMF
jgi:hypothetical protein